MTDTQEKDTNSSEKQQNGEPVKINKYDGTQIKNAVDDEVRSYLAESFKQSHIHTDIKLLLGYSSCLIAGAAFLFEYYTSFQEAKPVLYGTVALFWVLQAMLWAYATFVEKNEVFVGYKEDPKTKRRLGILTVTGEMERYSPLYKMTMTYQDQVLHKRTTLSVEKDVASWFTQNGVMVKTRVDKDLEDQVDTLFNQVHKD